MGTKTVPNQPAVPLWSVNCLVVFQNIFFQYNPFLIKHLKIPLKFGFTPILSNQDILLVAVVIRN